MYLVSVLPLERKARATSLTYFTKEHIAPGTLVSVPFRTGELRGLVTEIQDVSSAKSDLKNAPWSTRKVTRVLGPSFLTPSFIRSAEILARFHVTPLSTVFSSLVPRAYLDFDRAFWKKIQVGEQTATDVIPETLVLQNSWEERLGFYRTTIRESFARKQSIFLAVPTMYSGERLAQELSKGIADYVILLTSDLSIKELTKRSEQALTEQHAVLIIATPQFAALPRHDYGTIIIEQEGSTTYRSVARPHIDARRFLELWSRENGIRVIFADTIPSMTTAHRLRIGEANSIGTPTLRPHERVSETIIPRTEETKPKTGFTMLLEPLQRALNETMHAGKHTFLFSLRNGVATFTVCRDCGSTVSCEHCGVPLVLYETEKGRTFICNACKSESASKTTCRHCNSWNLIPLGIGIDGLFKEVAEHVPKEKLFRIDRMTVTTAKRGHAVVERFLKTPGAVLIGTELALPYLDPKSVALVGVVSFDSLFHVPSYRVGERIVRLLEDLRLRTEETFLIQTAEPEHPLLSIRNRTSLISWQQSELEERKQFGYPPFTTIIKAVLEGDRELLEEEAKKIRQDFAQWKPDIFPNWEQTTKKKLKLTMILRVPEEYWTLTPRGGFFEPKLYDLLEKLAKQAEITVDPENLL